MIGNSSWQDTYIVRRKGSLDGRFRIPAAMAAGNRLELGEKYRLDSRIWSTQIGRRNGRLNGRILNTSGHGTSW